MFVEPDLAGNLCLTDLCQGSIIPYSNMPLFLAAITVWIPIWVTEALNMPQNVPNMVLNDKFSQPYSLLYLFWTKYNVVLI